MSQSRLILDVFEVTASANYTACFAKYESGLRLEHQSGRMFEEEEIYIALTLATAKIGYERL